MDYIDNTIIRLRREYSKDELVQALNRQLSEKDKEIGMLKSEIDYLKSEQDKLKADYELKLKQLNTKLTEQLSFVNKEAIKDVRKEEAYKTVLQLNHKLNDKLKERKKENERLLLQLIKLQNK